MEANSPLPPNSARPSIKNLKILNDDIDFLKNLLPINATYPQSLRQQGVDAKKWQSIWRKWRLNEAQSNAFERYIIKSKKTLYVALVDDIRTCTNGKLKVAVAVTPNKWTVSFLEAGFLYVPHPDPEHSFFSNLTWCATIYFHLPIDFVYVRNGDSMVDPAIFAGTAEFIELMMKINPKSWHSGLPE